MLDLPKVVQEVRQYVALQKETKDIGKRQTEVKKRLQDAVIEFGETDDRGHIRIELNDAVSGVAEIVNQRRVSKALDIEVAEKLLEEKGLAESCMTMIPVLDEDAIMAAYYQGKLTEADIDAMFPPKVSWAFVVNTG